MADRDLHLPEYPSNYYKDACTPALVNKARLDQHVAGAEGVTHAMVQKQIEAIEGRFDKMETENKEDHEVIMKRLDTLMTWQKVGVVIISVAWSIITIVVLLFGPQIAGHFSGG